MYLLTADKGIKKTLARKKQQNQAEFIFLSDSQQSHLKIAQTH